MRHVKKYGRGRPATGNVIRRIWVCVLANYSYRHIFRICNAYCVSTAAVSVKVFQWYFNTVACFRLLLIVVLRVQ